MKVGTDGCLLGAWAHGGSHVLDVGTGTGLVALMMAQRFPEATVTGIDIDADAVSQAEIYRDAFAISVCTAEDLPSPTVIGAQAANELLNIVGIKASFVLTEYNDKIYISSRSIDEIDVQRIMERLGGGGHLNVAGAQIKDAGLDEVKAMITDVIDELIEEGKIEKKA